MAAAQHMHREPATILGGMWYVGLIKVPNLLQSQSLELLHFLLPRGEVVPKSNVRNPRLPMYCRKAATKSASSAFAKRLETVDAIVITPPDSAYLLVCICSQCLSDSSNKL